MFDILCITISLSLMLFIVFIVILTKKEKFTNNPQITILLLNYKRPHNTRTLLPYLIAMDEVGQIIVSNGAPEWRVEWDHPKITIWNDYANNSEYGAARRFITPISIMEYPYILSLDDDLLPSHTLVKYLLELVIKEPKGIYGPYGRICNKNGYWIRNHNDANIVLTGLAIMGREVIANFQNHWLDWRDYLRDTHGNGEDIIFNHVFKKTWNKNPIWVNAHLTHRKPHGMEYMSLDGSNGYSSLGSHFYQRNRLCKLLTRMADKEIF